MQEQQDKVQVAGLKAIEAQGKVIEQQVVKTRARAKAGIAEKERNDAQDARLKALEEKLVAR